MAEKNKKTEILICMGSSCFARGNNQTIGIIKKYLEKYQLDDKVELKGNLCVDVCKQGPTIEIDGKRYYDVEPISIIDILEFHLDRGKQ